jgi:HEAT repeat protein
LETLRRIERLNLISVLPAVRKRFKYEGSVLVRGASLRVLAALGDAEALEEVYPYLEEADPRLRQGAMVGLLRSGDLAGILAAGEMLNELVNSPDPAKRQFAAQALGEAGITSFYRPLVKLLQDEALPVQRAAVMAAGKVKHPALWPFVVKSLATAKVRTAGMKALVAGGEAVLSHLDAAFGKNGSGPEEGASLLFAGHERGVMIRLARICGRIGGARAVDLLQSQLKFPDVEVRTQVLLALSRCGYQAGGEAQPAIHQEIRAEVAGAAWTLAALLDLIEEPDLAGRSAVSLLTAALNKTLAQYRKRLFLWLSFIYDPRLIRQVQDNLNHASAEKKSYALEIIDVRVEPALKSLLMPIFDDVSPVQQLQQLNGMFPQPRLDYKMRLGDIITKPSTWLTPWPRICALYVMAQLSAAELAEAVIPALSTSDPLVRETAAWALNKLDPALFERHRPGLRLDPSPQIAKIIKQLETMTGEESMMVATIEKIIRLKSMDLFAESEEEVLADVASILEELDIPAGETFLQKGDLGSSLYIIIEGRAKVHEGERILAELGENDIFGELALLDPAPRSAAVTALTDTRLFRLDQEPFYELLEDHTEVARKMLQILARRLRRTSEQTPPGREFINDLLGNLQEKLARPGRQE